MSQRQGNNNKNNSQPNNSRKAGEPNSVPYLDRVENGGTDFLDFDAPSFVNEVNKGNYPKEGGVGADDSLSFSYPVYHQTKHQDGENSFSQPKSRSQSAQSHNSQQPASRGRSQMDGLTPAPPQFLNERRNFMGESAVRRETDLHAMLDADCTPHPSEVLGSHYKKGNSQQQQSGGSRSKSGTPPPPHSMDSLNTTSRPLDLDTTVKRAYNNLADAISPSNVVFDQPGGSQSAHSQLRRNKSDHGDEMPTPGDNREQFSSQQRPEGQQRSQSSNRNRGQWHDDSGMDGDANYRHRQKEPHYTQPRSGQEEVQLEDDYREHPSNNTRGDLRSTAINTSPSSQFGESARRRRGGDMENGSQQRRLPHVPTDEELMFHAETMAQVEAMDMKNKELMADLDGAQLQLDGKDQEIMTMRSKITQLEKVNRNQDMTIQDLKNTLSEKAKEYDADIAQLEEKHAAEISAVHEDANALEREQSEKASKQINDIKKEMSKVQNKNDVLEEELKNARGQNQTLRERLDTVTRKLDDTQSDRQNQSHDLKELNGKCYNLEQDLKELVQIKERLEDQTARDTEEIHTMKQELAALRQRGDGYKEMVKAAERERHEAVEEIREQLLRKDAELGRLLDEHESLKGSYKADWEKLERGLEQDLAAEKQKLIAQHDKLTSEALDAFGELKSERDALCSELASLKHKQEATRRSLDARDETSHRLEQQLHRKCTELSELAELHKRAEHNYKNQLQQRDEEMMVLRDRNDQEIQELRETVKRLNDLKQNDRLDSEHQVTSAKSQVERLKTELSEADAKAQHWERKFSNANRALQEAKDSERRVEDDLHYAERTIKALKEEKEQAYGANAKVTEQLEKFKRMYTKATNDLEDAKENQRHLQIRQMTAAVGRSSTSSGTSVPLGGGGGGAQRVATPLLKNSTNTPNSTSLGRKTPTFASANEAASPTTRISGLVSSPLATLLGRKTPITDVAGEDCRPSQRRRHEQRCIAFSGYPIEEKQRMIKVLKSSFPGVRIDDGVDGMINPEVTHLITEATNATVKLWSARLGGCWVLPQTFIDACEDGAKGCIWPDEAKYATRPQTQVNPFQQEVIGYTGNFCKKTPCFSSLKDLSDHFKGKLLQVDSEEEAQQYGVQRMLYHKADIKKGSSASDKFGADVKATTWSEFHKQHLL